MSRFYSSDTKHKRDMITREMQGGLSVFVSMAKRRTPPQDDFLTDFLLLETFDKARYRFAKFKWNRLI